MTQPPAFDAPPILPDQQRRRTRTAVAWTVIVLCLVVTFVLRHQFRQNAAVRESDAAGELGLRLASRVLVGHKAALQSLGQSLESAQETLDEQLNQIKAAAQSPRHRLMAAPVIAEIRGADEAIRYIDQIPGAEGDLRSDAKIIRAIYTRGADTLIRDQRLEVEDRYGWSGTLALSWQLPADDPLRRQAITPALRTFVTMVAAVVGVVALVAIGLGLLILAIVWARKGRLTTALEMPSFDPGLLVQAFAVYLVWFLVASLLQGLLGGARGPWSPWIVLAGLAPLAIFYPILRGVRTGELRRAVGWNAGRGLFREIGAGITGYVAGLPIVVVGFFLTWLLSRILATQPSHPAVEMISREPWKILLLLGLAVVYAPIVEELLFRGALYGGTRSTRGIIVSSLIVSAVFAAMHPRGIAGIPVLMSIAVVFALMREWRGSLIAPIVAHAINNGTIIGFLILAAA
jgi:membrane protease YdiL (CAAX protease family)